MTARHNDKNDDGLHTLTRRASSPFADGIAPFFSIFLRFFARNIWREKNFAYLCIVDKGHPYGGSLKDIKIFLDSSVG